MADRYVEYQQYPIRPSSWKPVIPEPAREESFLPYRNGLIQSSVHPDVFRAWLSYSDNITPLFPNLRCVWWSVIRGIDDLELCPLLMGSALRALRFGFGWQKLQHRCGELIREAHTRCPLLDSLDLSGLNEHPAFSPELADKVFEVTKTIRMDKLQSFICHFSVPAPTALVRYLVSLPNLQCLDVVASPDLTFRGLASVLPTVRKLGFACTTLHQASELLTVVESDCIRVLNITLEHSQEGSSLQLAALLQIMTRHPSASALRDIILVGRSRTWMEHKLAREDLAPILDLPRVRLCNLQGFFMEDPELIVDHMFGAWAELEELAILYQPVSMSLAAFLDVARAHPRLRDVSTAIRITHRAGSVLPSADMFVHYALRRIHVRLEDSGIETCASVAHVLCTTFPGLHWADGFEFRMEGLLYAGQRARAAGTPWTEDRFRLHDQRRQVFLAETWQRPPAPACRSWPLALRMSLVNKLKR
jgi:hypothetical protein